jgi:hypothetical protein
VWSLGQFDKFKQRKKGVAWHAFYFFLDFYY